MISWYGSIESIQNPPSREETIMAVSLSESAAKEVKKIITDQNLP